MLHVFLQNCKIYPKLFGFFSVSLGFLSLLHQLRLPCIFHKAEARTKIIGFKNKKHTTKNF